jgi:hypothetical protein
MSGQRPEVTNGSKHSVCGEADKPIALPTSRPAASAMCRHAQHGGCGGCARSVPQGLAKLNV